MSTTVARGFPHLRDEMWGTLSRADKRIAGLQSTVLEIAISGIIIELAKIPTSMRLHMNS
jgi:hypothetical protein